VKRRNFNFNYSCPVFLWAWRWSERHRIKEKQEDCSTTTNFHWLHYTKCVFSDTVTKSPGISQCMLLDLEMHRQLTVNSPRVAVDFLQRWICDQRKSTGSQSPTHLCSCTTEKLITVWINVISIPHNTCHSSDKLITKWLRLLSCIGADFPGAVGANAPIGKGLVGACTQRKNWWICPVYFFHLILSGF